jgi:metal-responsive CopG/Arc/MetJ family transcriptional regulator
MKTAVSLPDKVFAAAETLARRLRLSRSALYARALERLLADEQGARITERLNAVYGARDSTLDSRLAVAQSQALGPDEW